MSKRLTVGSVAPVGTALNVAGEPIQIEHLWQDGPILLTFLRHFG